MEGDGALKLAKGPTSSVGIHLIALNAQRWTPRRMAGVAAGGGDGDGALMPLPSAMPCSPAR